MSRPSFSPAKPGPAIDRCLRFVDRLEGEVRELPADGDARGRVLDILAGLREALDHGDREPEDRPGDPSQPSADAAADEDRVVFPPSRFTTGEVLQFLAFRRKTGTVCAALPEEGIELDLRRGVVVDARSDRPPPGFRLAEILVRRGHLDQKDVILCVEESKKSRKRFGRWLLHHGLISRASHALALQEQTRAMVQRILEARRAPLQFLSTRNPYGQPDMRLDLMSLILACIDGPK